MVILSQKRPSSTFENFNIRLTKRKYKKWHHFELKKRKPANVGRIALKRQAGAKTVDSHRDSNH